jgi:ribosome-binding factor A
LFCTVRLELELPFSSSLKDKRQTLRSLKDRLRRRNVSVVESDQQDLWQRATMEIALAAVSRGAAEEKRDERKAVSGRTRKVESQLKEITGEEVASLSDPRIQGLVTVTGVRVSPDLAHATVFYSVLAGEDAMAANEGLQSAAGRIQAAVGAQMRLKRTPRLHFEPDPVVERATRIEAALREVRSDEDAHEK